MTFADDAIAIFLDASGGYPYFLQEYGRAAWESSAGPVITEDDARTSVILGPYRANLINKGLLYAPDHGILAYTVPNMAEYVNRHREDLD